MKKIYVCSPYSGDVEKNVNFARKVSREVALGGHLPITPHLLFPQFISEEMERELAIRMNIELLIICDELWVFGNKITKGMAEEIKFIEESGKRIRYFKLKEVD